MPDKDGNITVEELVEMLVWVLDAHYGAAVHHIGDGDGIAPEQAAKIQAFWTEYLEARCMVRAVTNRIELAAKQENSMNDIPNHDALLDDPLERNGDLPDELDDDVDLDELRADLDLDEV